MFPSFSSLSSGSSRVLLPRMAPRRWAAAKSGRDPDPRMILRGAAEHRGPRTTLEIPSSLSNSSIMVGAGRTPGKSLGTVKMLRILVILSSSNALSAPPQSRVGIVAVAAEPTARRRWGQKVKEKKEQQGGGSARARVVVVPAALRTRDTPPLLQARAGRVGETRIQDPGHHTAHVVLVAGGSGAASPSPPTQKLREEPQDQTRLLQDQTAKRLRALLGRRRKMARPAGLAPPLPSRSGGTVHRVPTSRRGRKETSESCRSQSRACLG